MIPLDPLTFLLGASMVLLAAATTVSLLVHKHPPAADVLLGMLCVSFLALFGVACVDLFGVATPVVTEQTRSLSLVAATHRRLLLILPFCLVACSAVILAVYRERIADKHARDYRNAVAFSCGFSLIATIVIAIESMI